MANSIALALSLWGVCSLSLWGTLKQADLWPGWFPFSAMVLPAAFLVGRVITSLAPDSKQEPMLRLLSSLITGVVALAMVWLVFAELGVAVRMELASAFRFGFTLCLVVIVICGVLALSRRLPSSLPSVLSLELALLTFGVITNGVISMGLALFKWLLIDDPGLFRFGAVVIGLGVTYLLAVRGFFTDQTRNTLRFGTTWLPAVVGSIFAASIAVHLLFATELRLSGSDDRVLIGVNNGLALFFISLVIWILVFGRRRYIVSWASMAVVAIASIYLVAETRAERRQLWKASEVARKARFALRSQNFDDSLGLWQEVLEVREKALPGSHELVAEALRGKGNALYGLGRPAEAVEVLSDALKITEASGRGSELEASLLRAKLALSLQRMGRIVEANLVLASLDTSKLLKLPTGEFELGTMLIDVADVCRRTGRFEEAAQLYRRSIEAIKEAKYRDRDSEFRAESGLVKVLLATGRYEEARTRVRDLRIRMSTSFRPLFMAECFRLEAEIDGSLERFSSAVHLQKQALQALVKHHGRDHPDTAVILRDLGTYLIGTGNLREAFVACNSARAILLDSLGADSPEIVKADYALACAYAAAMRYQEAVALVEKCLDRWLEMFGDGYFLVSEARHLHARLLAETGDHRAASDLYARSQEIALENFRSSLTTLSDQQQLAALRRLQQRSAEFIIHTVDHRTDDPAVVGRCFDGWLRIKGLLLEIQRARGEMLSRSPSEDVAEAGKRLRVIENRLASLWFEGRADRDGRDEVARLQKEKTDLENELNEWLAESGFWVSNEVVTSRTLEERLPAGTAYVDYCWARSGVGPDRYLAFVLPAGGVSGPQLVDLGRAQDVERSVGEYFAAVSYGLEKHPSADPISRRLYDTVIRPVLPMLVGSQDLLVSPDGVLARLPFSAVIQPSGEFLEDRYRISYLSSGRDVALWDRPHQRKRSAIIFADPNYDSVPPKIHIDEGELSRARGSRRRSWRAPPLAGVRLERLPGTLVEAEGIARLLEERSSLDVLLFTDLNASEEAMAFIESPWLMHLATHGYFFPPENRVLPRDLPPSMALLGLGGFQASPEDNPLARAGLALAGANPALKSGEEWGLLTLDEVMAMPLVDTEMVVVSACESGIGEIRQGEGVFGVGRAFLAAGSRSVVVTLWSVADGPTAELMQDFYARWLAGESKAEALRQARAKLRRKYPSVAIWAPFVLVGDPS